MRYGAILAVLLCVTVFTASSEIKSDRRVRRPVSTAKQTRVRQMIGPKALVTAGGTAAFGQARNRPREWGQGPAGFAKRFGSALGKHVMNKSIQFTVAGIRHEELGYQPSNQKGFGPRLKHALVGTVVTHKTTTGRKTVAAGEISGAVGSGLISRLWQPASLHTVASGFSTAGISLGVDAGKNVAQEFWPRHPSRRAKK